MTLINNRFLGGRSLYFDMGVLLVILMVVPFMQAKVLVPKCDHELKVVATESASSVWEYNKHCEELADHFCDRAGLKSCPNFRMYCSLILDNLHKVKGLRVNVEQLWDSGFQLLDQHMPLWGNGIAMISSILAENQPNMSKRLSLGKNCPSGCDRSFKPVCGGLLYFFQRTTYPNECTMKMAACEGHKPIIKVKDGQC